MQNVIRGKVLEAEKLIMQYFPKLSENANLKSLLKYQYFIELVKDQNLFGAIEFAQDQMQNMEKVDFIHLNDQQIPEKISFQVVTYTTQSSGSWLVLTNQIVSVFQQV